MMASTDAQNAGFSGGAFGLADESDGSLCLLSTPFDAEGMATLFSYGGDRARERLLALLKRWQASGSPAVSDVEIEVP